MRAIDTAGRAVRVRRLHRRDLAPRPVPHGRRLREGHGGRHVGDRRGRDGWRRSRCCPRCSASPGAPSTASRCGAGRRAERPREQRMWFRWSRVVQRRPWPAFVGGLVDPDRARDPALLDAPRLPRRRRQPDVRHDAAGLRPRRPTGFGAGFNGPLVLAAEFPEGRRHHRRSTRSSPRLRDTPDVAAVTSADDRARRATPPSSA